MRRTLIQRRSGMRPNVGMQVLKIDLARTTLRRLTLKTLRPARQGRSSNTKTLGGLLIGQTFFLCLLYTSPSPRDA